MKTYFLAAMLVACAMSVSGQEKKDLIKLIETEKSFARSADQKGIKAAFLEFLADDGILFQPSAVNGKESWRARADSPALLSWHPVFVDTSTNGVFGYTVGAGEYRPRGKSDTTVYYSDYLTLWQRQPDGEYKAALDVGVSHDKPAATDQNWKSPAVAGTSIENKMPASSAANLFFDTATLKGLNKAYQMFASEDTRFLREDKQPILGKNSWLGEYEKDKRSIGFGRNMTLQSAGDLAYLVTTYELKDRKNSAEKGNIVQVWKFTGEKWLIVADVFSPITEKK